MAPRLLLVVAAPVAIYAVGSAFGAGQELALALGGVVPAVWTTVGLVLRRRVDPITLISLVGFAFGLGLSLLFGGNPLFLKLQEAPLTGAVGVAALVSVAVGKPLAGVVSRLARQSEAASAIVTLVIGLTLLLDACTRLALALTLPTPVFLAVHREVDWVIFGAGLVTLTGIRRRAARRAS